MAPTISATSKKIKDQRNKKMIEGLVRMMMDIGLGEIGPEHPNFKIKTSTLGF